MMTATTTNLKGRGTKAKTTEAEKVEYIKTKFPEYQNTNPYRLDPKIISHIKRSLIMDGYYQHNDYLTYNVEDERIIKLLLLAQGKKAPIRRR